MGDASPSAIESTPATPFYTALGAFASEVTSDASRHRALAATTSRQEFTSALLRGAAAAGHSLDSGQLAHHLDLLLTVDPPYYFANPNVSVDLKKLPRLARWCVVAAWLGSRVTSRFDTPPLYGRRFDRWRELLGRRRQLADRVPTKAAERSEMARVYSARALASVRAMHDALGPDTWRMVVDWEDQEYGPEVYDLQKHQRRGTEPEPGYLAHSLDAYGYLSELSGRRLSLEQFEEAHRRSVRYRTKRARSYNTGIREFWRPRDWADPDVFDDIEPCHLRRYKHRHFEVLAFRYANPSDVEAFRRAYPLTAELFLRKYGHLNLSARILDREYLRFRVCYFDRPCTVETMRAKIVERLDEFYDAMADLEREKSGLGAAADRCEAAALEAIADKQLLEIARLQKFIEYLRPFGDGNTRLSNMILHKLLADFDFTPAILAQRNDAPYRSDRNWRGNIREGMARWQAVRHFAAMGLLEHVLSLRE